MFVPQAGAEQLNDKGGSGQIQPRLSCHLGIDFEYIDQDSGCAVIRAIKPLIQIPDQVGVKLIAVVFEQPGVTVWQLTGWGWTPDELSIEALEHLLLQARQLACETNPRTQPDQVNRLQDLPGIVTALHRAGITTPVSRAGHQVQVEQGRAVRPVHRLVFSAAALRIREA